MSRKYLPAACEKHKLLHARCPANCPERLLRDAQMSTASSESSSSQSPSVFSQQ
jgi:hypothetical protein